MNFPGKRILLGTAVAVAALGVGGFAYAAGNDDPAPDQGYVTVEEGTPAADNPSTAPQQGGTGSGAATRDGRDCPDKQGTGGQGQQGQGEQGQSTQPSEPQQTQPSEQNPAGNA